MRTKDFQESVVQICNSRKDEWAEAILGRLASINDLHAADAVYHQQCSSNFRTGKRVPVKCTDATEHTPKQTKVGRPDSKHRTEAFMKVVHYLEENDDELITINDLVLLMSENLKNSEYTPYSAPYMKTRLQQHFGQRLMMTTLTKKACVITLRQTAMSILHEFHKEQQRENTEDEKLRIIRTAAKLIESDVKSMDPQVDVYPPWT